MKTAVSIPDCVFESAESFARRLSMSRSDLYTRAIQEFLEAHRHDAVTEKLNEAYADEDPSVDPVLTAMQATALEDDEWEFAAARSGGHCCRRRLAPDLATHVRS